MKTYDLQRRVADNIRRLRKGKFTQETLAEAAGISIPTINGIEGCRRGFSDDTLVKLANALNCDVHELFIPAPEESSEMSDLYKTIGIQIAGEIQSGMNNILDKWLNEARR